MTRQEISGLENISMNLYICTSDYPPHMAKIINFVFKRGFLRALDKIESSIS